MNLQTNRYNTTVPTAINDAGCSISVPFYIQPTNDQKKTLLNAFRSIKNAQLAELGYDPQRKEGQLVVIDSLTPPQTPIENELGMTEENLRLHLFSRQGLQERLVIKLQNLTGIECFTKDQVIETYHLWLNTLYPENNEHKRTKKTPSKTTTRNTAKEV